MVSKSTSYLLIVALLLISACAKDEPITPDTDNSILITIAPEQTYQTMIGFGGSLSWYCDRITKSPKQGEIMDLIINDLGLDVLRLKNWYYPADYPTNKSPDAMEVSWFLNHYEATNEIYDLAKARNPALRVLLSSWGPPSHLKSNGMLDYGTLKKQDGEFMYDEYATYWEDVLNHISFSPDYLSIQNEPTWVSDYETCEWRPTETDDFPGYDRAFDLVAEKLQAFSEPPIMVGPESANLSTEAFNHFAEAIKTHESLGAYGYHPYNFNDNSSLESIQNTLSDLGDNFADKPKIMTEYSGMNWINTARFINSNLREANAAAYIYWTLAWAQTDDAMIIVDESGDYVITPFYHLLKHFAKYIDAGYQRVEVAASDDRLDVTGFLNPAGDELTIITIQPEPDNLSVRFEVAGKTTTDMVSYQSFGDQMFRQFDTDPTAKLGLRSESVTTTVLQIR